MSVKGADGKKTAYTYDLNGQRIGTDGYREDTAYTYDEVGNLVSQVTSGKYDVSLDYTYDLSGRMISESRTENGAAVESSYIYDAIGQLKEFTRGDYTESYTYDPAGNMLSKTAGGIKTQYTYNAGNQLVGDGTFNYTYDKIGNLVEKRSDGWRIVGAGVQADISGFSWALVDFGSEVVIYTDEYVINQTYPEADFLVSVYIWRWWAIR